MKTSESKNSSESTHSATPFLSGDKKGSFFPSSFQNDHSFFGPSAIQPKLEIGQPDDEYEREADRVADTVMRMPDPQIQRQPVEEEEELQMKRQGPELQRKCEGCEEEGKVQKKVEGKASVSGKSIASHILSRQLSSSAGKGSRLPKAVQTEMGQKIGADFSGVNIHKDSKAHHMSQQLGAKAFTHGSDIYFNEGKYNPTSRSGKHLLAHELTHVTRHNSSAESRIYRESNNDDDGSIIGSVLGTAWSVVEDIGHGAERAGESWGLTGLDRAGEIGLENERAWVLFKDLVSEGAKVDGPLYNIIKFTIDHHIDDMIAEELTEEQRELIERGAAAAGEKAVTYIAGRILGSMIVKSILKRIAARVATTAAYKSLARKVGVAAGAGSTGIGIPVTGTIMLGVLQRASDASRELRESNSALYRQLRQRNLDMGYFLVKPMLSEIREQVRPAIQEIVAEELAQARESAQEEEKGSDNESDEIEYGEVGGATIHIIEEGDTLWELGKQYGVDPDELERLNEVEPRNLEIGEPLLIPEPESDELIVY